MMALHEPVFPLDPATGGEWIFPAHWNRRRALLWLVHREELRIIIFGVPRPSTHVMGNLRRSRRRDA
jgi:hypothetical protein